MKSFRRLPFLTGCAAALCLIASASARPAATPRWAGDGQARIIVDVPPVSLAAREGSDELVASYSVDFDAMRRELKLGGAGIDLSSLQVQRIDSDSGEPIAFKPFDGSRTPADRPCRFDDAYPDAYQSRITQASEQPDGLAPQVTHLRKARLFNREVLPTRGKVVFVHTQDGDRPSRYAIYFNTTPKPTWQVPPSPWIGDADVLRAATGGSLGGQAHFSPCVGDLNGDGLFDLVGGAEKGDLLWYPNHGSAGKPLFTGCRILEDEKGPMDVGWYAVPFVIDWDNDGLPDLLVGTSHNVILWWKNVGTKTDPKWSSRGFVTADGGKKLSVPEAPVEEDQHGVFKRDYYNQPWVGDLDGDGIPDLLTGGYTTGRIFHYRGTGRDGAGVPKLEYVGEVSADGQPIDTCWAAGPAVADVDGDGKPDLITGSWWWSGIPTPAPAGQSEFLMYYRNVGEAGKPVFARAPFPKRGDFPKGAIVHPAFVDWNADGLIDILNTDNGGDVRVFLNEGTAKSPNWRTTEQRLEAPWAFISTIDPTATPAGTDAQGRALSMVGTAFFARGGSAYTPTFVRAGAATCDGKPIGHAGPGYGDPYAFTTLHDWDHDGKLDLLWGTQQGNVYLHRAVPGAKPFEFDAGTLMKLSNGQPLKVGPPVVGSPEEAKDFTILQGSRILLVGADFDGDGIDDLIVTETNADLLLFRGTKPGAADAFAEPIKLATLPSRTGCLLAIDWNADGRPDILTEGTFAKPGLLFLNETKPGGAPTVSKPVRPFELPFMFWGPSFGASDWNGDGDRDVMVRSEFYAFYVEQSFLAHGYCAAKRVSLESKDATP